METHFNGSFVVSRSSSSQLPDVNHHLVLPTRVHWIVVTSRSVQIVMLLCTGTYWLNTYVHLQSNASSPWPSPIVPILFVDIAISRVKETHDGSRKIDLPRLLHSIGCTNLQECYKTWNTLNLSIVCVLQKHLECGLISSYGFLGSQ